MVRAAAKIHGSAAVVTSPAQYGDLLKAIASNGYTLEQRRRLAAQAYAHTAAYDAAVSSWFAASYAPDEIARETGWPDLIAQVWTRSDALRYGENPHQKAAIYLAGGSGGVVPPGERSGGSTTGSSRTGAADSGSDTDPGIANAEVLHGKAMSY